MMARRVEQVPTMRRVDIEEDSRDDDDMLLEQFFEESLENITVLDFLYCDETAGKVYQSIAQR
jgi:hypothetical protein